MQQTANYQLNQWDGEDRIMRVDFNSDNAKIEAALSGKFGPFEIIKSVYYAYMIMKREIVSHSIFQK